MPLCHRLRPCFIRERCRAHVCTDRNCTVHSHGLISALKSKDESIHSRTARPARARRRNASKHGAAR
eukprot:7396027-Alexandrium_andersonii.AAC.1